MNSVIVVVKNAKKLSLILNNDIILVRMMVINFGTVPSGILRRIARQGFLDKEKSSHLLA